MDQKQRAILIQILEGQLALLKQDIDLSGLVPWAIVRSGETQRVGEICESLSRIEASIEELSTRHGRCALGNDGAERKEVINLITGLTGNLARDRKNLEKYLRNARHITICDPYFFQWSGPSRAFSTEGKYTGYLIDLIPQSVQSLDLFFLPGPNKRIRQKFVRMIGSRGVTLKCYETNEIHDRVIINDNNEAVVVGTSFGGLGNKISFIIALPPEDILSFRDELQRIRDIIR